MHINKQALKVNDKCIVRWVIKENGELLSAIRHTEPAINDEFESKRSKANNWVNIHLTNY